MRKNGRRRLPQLAARVSWLHKQATKFTGGVRHSAHCQRQGRSLVASKSPLVASGGDRPVSCTSLATKIWIWLQVICIPCKRSITLQNSLNSGSLETDRLVKRHLTWRFQQVLFLSTQNNHVYIFLSPPSHTNPTHTIHKPPPPSTPPAVRTVDFQFETVKLHSIGIKDCISLNADHITWLTVKHCAFLTD